MTNTTTYPNLSTKPGSIANALATNINVITEMSQNRTVTLVDLMQFVDNLIMGINDKVIKSQATQRFIMSLHMQKSKTGITSLVCNTILAGDNNKVIK